MTSFTLSAMPIVFFAGLVAPLADNNWVSHQTFCDQTEDLLAEFEDQIGAATDARLEDGLRA